jgi:hypothetical protein
VPVRVDRGSWNRCRLDLIAIDAFDDEREEHP